MGDSCFNRERARKRGAYNYSGSSVSEIQIDDFKETSTAVKLEELPNDFHMPEFVSESNKRALVH